MMLNKEFQSSFDKELSILQSNVLTICSILFPNGTVEHGRYRVGSLKNDPGQSVAICLKTGCFIDFATGEKGGLLDLISIAIFGRIDRRSALKEGLLIIKRAPPIKKCERPPVHHESSREKAVKARRLFIDSEVITSDCVAAKYLEKRGLPLNAALRWHANVYHAYEKRKLPAIVAPIRDIVGEIIGAHRIYIDSITHTKAAIRAPKMILGSVKGGAVRLFTPLDVVGLTEGIEDALAVNAIYGIPCWSAVSGSNISQVAFPKQIKHVIIYGDNDSAGRRYAANAAERYREQGLRCDVVFPHNKDFNEDLLRGYYDDDESRENRA